MTQISLHCVLSREQLVSYWGRLSAYLAMRGIKTFPLRMERQCANALKVADSLAQHPNVDRVYFPADPEHPDAANVKRLFSDGLFGGLGQLRNQGRRS